MNARISKLPAKRIELGHTVSIDLQSRNVEGKHVTGFDVATARLARANFAFQSASRDPRFVVLRAAAAALFGAMKRLRKALMLSGISRLGHFGEFGVSAPWKLARKNVTEQVQQCRLLVQHIKQTPKRPTYLEDCVRAVLTWATRLESAEKESLEAQSGAQTAGLELRAAQTEWKARYDLLKGWVALRDHELGTSLASEIFPQAKPRSKPKDERRSEKAA